MNRRILRPFLAVALAAALLATPAVAQPFPLQREIPVSPGQLLDLDLESGGTIRVVGGEGSVVRVRVEQGSRGCRPECRAEVEQTPSGVRVHTYQDDTVDNRSSSLNVTVEVPRRFDVKVNSTGGGVEIDNVTGEIRGKTMGGALELRRLGGHVDLTTMGGGIRISDSRIDGKVHTMGGQVTMENVEGDVQGSTMGGKVVRRGVGSGVSASSGRPEVVRVSTMGGDINLAEAAAGADVNTMGGDIRIERSGGPVKARTMGGRIRLDAVDGAVHATTMGGDVDVRMVGDPSRGDRDVQIQSMGGDIELTVPAGLSMDVEIELAFTRGKEGRYEITSDFPLQTRTTDSWDDRNGTPRKYIYGTGTVADGRNTVRIRTVNGNVRLIRGQ